HAVAQQRCGMSLLGEHGLECLFHVVGTPIGQSGNDCPARKNLGVGCEHDRSHCTAGRETGYENLAAVDAELCNGVLDHLADRVRLALAAGSVAWQEPRKTIAPIVCGVLPGVKE